MFKGFQVSFLATNCGVDLDYLEETELKSWLADAMQIGVTSN